MTTDLKLFEAVEALDKSFRNVYVKDVFDLPHNLKQQIMEGDMILLEGPLPGNVLSQIQK